MQGVAVFKEIDNSRESVTLFPIEEKYVREKTNFDNMEYFQNDKRAGFLLCRCRKKK